MEQRSDRPAMEVKKIDHISIAVNNLDAARALWEPLLGKSKPDDAYVDEPEKIRVARYWIGEVGFELMESTSPDGAVARFIEKHGEGIMLISFSVDNTRSAVTELREKGYPLIPDAQGKIIRSFRYGEFAFVHPNKLNGVLTEIID
jgi:methylmalonyl-CoA/ethylmalonyl-CoA epimerase